MFMMKLASLKIIGNVQMVGFRTFIKNVADSLNVTGFAGNEADGSVNVVCEGDAEAIEGLINALKQNLPSFACIEELTAAYEAYKGDFIRFEWRGADVPGEGETELVALMRSFDKKGEVMVGFLGSMNETLKAVKEDTSMMLDKQDMMLEKQDMMLDKQDMMLEKQDETIAEIEGVRTDLKSYMAEKFTKIEQDVEAIKAKLGMV